MKQRLIDANSLKSKAYKGGDWEHHLVVDWSDIEETDTGEAAPVVHGKWVEYMPILGAGDKQARCSECGLTPSGKTPYCPNCGARMDGEPKQNSLPPQADREAGKDGVCMSNFDRIKAMSVEEMAESQTDYCPPNTHSECCDTSCLECWTKWLQKERPNETFSADGG